MVKNKGMSEKAPWIVPSPRLSKSESDQYGERRPTWEPQRHGERVQYQIQQAGLSIIVFPAGRLSAFTIFSLNICIFKLMGLDPD